MGLNEYAGFVNFLLVIGMEFVLGRHDLKVLLSQLGKTVLKFTYGE